MIKNLRVCDEVNQLAAEPPYRFTFEYEDFQPQSISAEIINSKGEQCWATEGEFKLPYLLAKVELTRLEDYKFLLTLTDSNGKSLTAESDFKVGLLGDFGEARFIGSAFSDTAPVLHKSFNLKSKKDAVLYLLTLGFSKCYINGVEVSDDCFAVNSDYHFRSYENMRLIYPLKDELSYSQYYRAYNVAELLNEGENHIAVILGNGWYGQSFRIAEGHMEYGDPKCKLLLKTEADEIISDDSFNAMESHVIYNQLFVGEIHQMDLPLEPSLFGEAEESYSAMVFKEEEAVLRAAHFPPDRVTKKITPALLKRDDDGAVYDAGRNISGVVELVTSAEYGEKITVTYGGKLNSAGDIVNEHNQTDVFITSGKEDERLAPMFVWHGFRYFKVEGYTTDVTVFEIQSDLQPAGEFNSQNKMLNKAVELFENSQWSNMHCGVPSDCPHRERLGYTGDGQLTASAAMYFADCRAFYRKWLRDIADGQCKKSGHVQHTAPFGGGGGGPAGWGGAIINLPWQYYLHYGEIDVLEEYYPNMLRFLDYMESRSEDNLVLREEEGGWCLGEWETAPEKVALTEGYVNTCLYTEQLGILKQIAELLKEYTVSAELEHRIEEKRAAISNAYFHDGIWDCGSQGAPLFAWAAGVISLQEIIPILEEYRGGRIDTGIFGTPLLIKALFEADMSDVAIDLIIRDNGRSVGSMIIADGATTLSEALNGCGSDNHPMFGAFVSVLVENMLGVQLSAETAGFTGDWRILPFDGCGGRIFTPNGYINI